MTVGKSLREFAFGHNRHPESVLPAPRCRRFPHNNLPVAADLAYVDSLLWPVYGHAEHGAAYGHTKTAGKQCPT
ncbi:hypothetical protein [Rhodococcoides fascians]|uniref:hypothetical protein n=1 Tax=Rhodococcoides fascians TaxID=1828 RepID=UPI00068ED15B|nr:hypothetical protein [Rhodococcus fascians]